MSARVVIAVVLCMSPFIGAAQSAVPVLSVVPAPAKLSTGKGSFVLRATTPIVADTALRARGRQLASMLGPATGFDLPVVATAAAGPHIALRQSAALAKTLGPEGYQLSVTPAAVTIRAASPAGAFYGMQTLRQLLPPAIFRESPVSGQRWEIPAVSIVESVGNRMRSPFLRRSRLSQARLRLFPSSCAASHSSS